LSSVSRPAAGGRYPNNTSVSTTSAAALADPGQLMRARSLALLFELLSTIYNRIHCAATCSDI
jgi:hypothetical protein